MYKLEFVSWIYTVNENGSGTDEMLQITSIVVVNIFEVLHFYSVMTFLLGEATLLSWLKLDVAYQVGACTMMVYEQIQSYGLRF